MRLMTQRDVCTTGAKSVTFTLLSTTEEESEEEGEGEGDLEARSRNAASRKHVLLLHRCPTTVFT